MIQDISPNYSSASDFFIFARGAVGARLLKSSNRFTAYSSDPIELKLGRMILHMNPLDRVVWDSSISARGRCGSGSPLEIFKSTHRLQFYPTELKFDRMILDISPLNRSELNFSISFRRALWECASCNLQIGSHPTVLMRLRRNLAR